MFCVLLFSMNLAVFMFQVKPGRKDSTSRDGDVGNGGASASASATVSASASASAGHAMPEPVPEPVPEPALSGELAPPGEPAVPPAEPAPPEELATPAPPVLPGDSCDVPRRRVMKKRHS